MSSYPSLEGTSFSLSRWRQFWTPEKSWTDSFWISGRLLAVNPEMGELWLGSGEEKFRIIGFSSLEKNLEAHCESWVAFFIQKPNVITAGPTHLEIRGELSFRVLSPKIGPAFPQTASKNLHLRRQFLKRVRESLNDLGLQEMETPSLVPCPGMEPSLEPFTTYWTLGKQEQQLFLPTSPELHLKRLLCMGWTDIFEFKSCFRNGELSTHHQPEFLMLEWYRAFLNLDGIQQDLSALLLSLEERGYIQGELPSLKVLSLSQLFETHLKFSLTPETSEEELRDLCIQRGHAPTSSYSWDDFFHLLFVTEIEPELASYGPLIVKDFPPSQRAMARLTSEGWADRFEFYWRGLEIANAFHELNDPGEQAERFEKDRAERSRLGTRDLQGDGEFIEYLKWGMPPSAGIALGLDRLLMACQNSQNIEEWLSFPKRIKD